jgi:hypothetical protein
MSTFKNQLTAHIDPHVIEQGLPPPTTATRPGTPCRLQVPSARRACEACGFVTPPPHGLLDLVEATPRTWRHVLANPTFALDHDSRWVTARVLLARDGLVTAGHRARHLLAGVYDVTTLSYIATRPTPATTTLDEALRRLDSACAHLALMLARVDDPLARRRIHGVLAERSVSLEDIVQLGVHRAHRQLFEVTRRDAATRLQVPDLPSDAAYDDRPEQPS